MKMNKVFALFISSLCFAASMAHAGVVHVSGQIGNIDGDGNGAVNDLQIVQYTFTVATPGAVTIDADAQDFDSYMYLFNGSDQVIAQNDDQAPGNTDSYISTTLGAGTYMVALGSYIASPSDALQGYIQNWTFQDDRFTGSTATSGAWALTITTPTAVPVPGALPMFVSALVGLVGLARRQRRS